MPKIVKNAVEKLNILWMTWEIALQFLGKMYCTIILHGVN